MICSADNLAGRDSRTIGDSIEKTKEFHTRYLRAINSPIRRDILRALRDGDATIETLQAKTSLDLKALEWHLSILEYGFCVEKEVRGGSTFYKLSKEGEVVDFMDKEE
jgi:DNA-binding transcriptional ArsR family regulator